MSIIKRYSTGTRAAVKEILSGISEMMRDDDFTLAEFELEIESARSVITRAIKKYDALQSKKAEKEAKLTGAIPQSDTVIPMDAGVAALVEAVSDAAGELATEEPKTVPARSSKATKAPK